MKCTECEYSEYLQPIDTYFCNVNPKKPKRIARGDQDTDAQCRKGRRQSDGSTKADS